VAEAFAVFVRDTICVVTGLKTKVVAGSVTTFLKALNVAAFELDVKASVRSIFQSGLKVLEKLREAAWDC
jgi:hypothetical protein